MEARIAKPGKTLTISLYWVANFKLDEPKYGEIVKPAFKYMIDR